jgi:small subunit ribosomal protein S17
MAETRTGSRRVLRGTVVSDSMDKTVVVEVTTLQAHPVYRKRFRTTRKYYVHDSENQCEVGDVVLISEARPYSRTKRWRLTEIVQKAR